MLSIDTLDCANQLKAAGMSEEQAWSIAFVFGEVGRDPLGAKPSWIRSQMEAAGLTAEQAGVVARTHEDAAHKSAGT